VSGFTKYSDFVPTGPISTDLAALAYKGGLPLDAVISIGKRIMKSENVDLVGFHQHHGRHDASTRWWEEQMKAFAREIGIVSKALGNFQPREISIGGGFACPRDPFAAEVKFSEPYEYLLLHLLSKALTPFPKLRYPIISKIMEKVVVFKPKGKMAPSIEKYAAACGDTLREHLPKNNINLKGLTLQAEPGRSIHGNTGIHLTSVPSNGNRLSLIPRNSGSQADDMSIMSTTIFLQIKQIRNSLRKWIFSAGVATEIDYFRQSWCRAAWRSGI